MSKKSLKDDVKMTVNALLVPHVRGLTLDRLLKEYYDVENKQLPFRAMGYDTPADFLRSIPDAVHCITLRSGQYLLHAAKNENVSHIQDLVRGQRNTYNPRKSINQHLKQNQKSVFRQSAGNVYAGSYLSNNITQLPKIAYSYKNASTYSNAGQAGQSVLNTGIPPPIIKFSAQSRAGESLEQELILVSKLISLLQPHPNGVDVKELYDLFFKQYKTPINLDKIEKGLTGPTFFNNHKDLFFLWKDSENDSYKIALNNGTKRTAVKTADEPTPLALPPAVTDVSPAKHSPAIEPAEFRTSPTGAIPKTPSPKQQPKQQISPEIEVVAKDTNFEAPLPPDPVIVRPIVADQAAPEQRKWVATDIRFQDPVLSKKLQILTIEAEKTEEPIKPANIKSTSVTRIVSSDEPRLPSHSVTGRKPTVLSRSFGVSEPKVADVCTPDTVIPLQEFPSDVDDFEYFFIIVAELYSPGKFYWFFSEKRRAIEELTDDMTVFYSLKHDHKMDKREMYLGQLVAAQYHDNLWYRARIVRSYRSQFEVFFIDYGSVTYVEIERLRHLSLQFTTLPIQAFRGRMFGIKSHPNPYKWSIESGKQFLELVKNSKTIAAAKMLKEEECTDQEPVDIFVLNLVDTNGEKDLHLADFLVDKSLAAYNSEKVPGIVETVDLSDAPSNTNGAKEARVSSPEPTCPFPSSPAPERFICSPPLSIVNGDTCSEAASSYRRSKAPSRLSGFLSKSAKLNLANCPHVKQLNLSDGRKLHVVRDGEELFLPEYDFKQLVPSLDRQITAFKMNVDRKILTIHSHPRIFLDANKCDAEWTKDEDSGDLVEEITVFPLKIISPLLYIFGVKEKEAGAAIEAQIKNFGS